MPGENFSRRVARAAAVGGSRSYRGQTPLVWYAVLLSICLVGTGLVAYSRYERTHPTVAAAKLAEPPTKADLWQAGVEVYVCGKVDQLPASVNAGGPFATNGHGVVTIEPGLSSDPSAYSGKNAILNAFLLPADVILSNTTLELPGHQKTTATTTTTSTTSSTTTTSTTSSTTTSTTTTTPSKGSTTTTSSSPSTTTTTVPAPPPIIYKNGQSCEGKKGVVEVEVWKSPSAKTGTIVTKNAGSIRFKNGQLITVAFVPKGSAIPKPSSTKAIADFLISNPTGLAPVNQSTATTQATTTTTGGVTSTTAGPTPGTSGSTTTTQSKGSKKTSG